MAHRPTRWRDSIYSQDGITEFMHDQHAAEQAPGPVGARRQKT